VCNERAAGASGNIRITAEEKSLV
jgi:hypothetical protein